MKLFCLAGLDMQGHHDGLGCSIPQSNQGQSNNDDNEAPRASRVLLARGQLIARPISSPIINATTTITASVIPSTPTDSSRGARSPRVLRRSVENVTA